MNSKSLLMFLTVHGDMHVIEFSVDLPSVTEILGSRDSTNLPSPQDTLFCLLKLRCQVCFPVNKILCSLQKSM